jgi:hypothetical protein
MLDTFLGNSKKKIKSHKGFFFFFFGGTVKVNLRVNFYQEWFSGKRTNDKTLHLLFLYAPKPSVLTSSFINGFPWEVPFSLCNWLALIPPCLTSLTMKLFSYLYKCSHPDLVQMKSGQIIYKIKTLIYNLPMRPTLFYTINNPGNQPATNQTCKRSYCYL